MDKFRAQSLRFGTRIVTETVVKVDLSERPFKYWREGRGGFVNPHDADLFSGKAEIDAECRHWEDGGIEEVEKARLANMRGIRRFWEKMW